MNPHLDNIHEKLEELITKVNSVVAAIKETPLPKFLVINGKERCKIEDILFLEADNQQTIIYLNAPTTPQKKTAINGLGHYESILPKISDSNSEGFIKVHKSFLVNKAHIGKITRNPKTKKGGKCYLLNYDDSVSIPISDTLFISVKEELCF